MRFDIQKIPAPNCYVTRIH